MTLSSFLCEVNEFNLARNKNAINYIYKYINDITHLSFYEIEHKLEYSLSCINEA